MRIVALVFCLLTPAQAVCGPKKKKQKIGTTNKQSHSQKQSEQERFIEITNGIEPSMLEYHYFGKHSPTKFSISINDKQLDPKNSHKVPIKKNHVNVRYDYEFAQGLYKGSKIVDLEVEPNAQSVVLNFSWKDPLRISANHARAESIKPAKKST